MIIKKNKFNLASIFMISIVLAMIFAPLAKFIDEYIAGIYCGGIYTVIFSILFDSFKFGCYFQGVIYFFIFWLSIFTFTFLEQSRAWLIFFEGTILFWIMSLFSIIFNVKMSSVSIDDFGSLIIMLILFIVGYGIAFGLKKINNFNAS